MSSSLLLSDSVSDSSDASMVLAEGGGFVAGLDVFLEDLVLLFLDFLALLDSEALLRILSRLARA